MRQVHFAKAYDHPTPTGHVAYPAGFEGQVPEDVAAAAEKAGRLKSAPAAKPAPKA